MGEVCSGLILYISIIPINGFEKLKKLLNLGFGAHYEPLLVSNLNAARRYK